MQIEVEVIVDYFSDGREPLARVRKAVFNDSREFLGKAFLTTSGDWVMMRPGERVIDGADLKVQFREIEIEEEINATR